MLTRRTVIALLLVAGFFLASYPPAEVLAASNPIELRLGGAGSTSWNIGNVKPGDSGTITVTLHNDGTLDGFVTIWISNIVSIEGPAGRPGRLSDYLLLNVSVPGLETNLSLPVVMANFPQSTSGSNYVRVSPVSAGAFATLVWRWELPPQTGNDVQGNGISFSINYALQELPPPEPSPEPQPEPSPQPAPGKPEINVPPSPPLTLQVTLDGKTNTVEISADGTLAKSLELADSQGNFILDIKSGTRVTGINGQNLNRMELTIVDGPFVVPDNMIVLSPIYKITGYSQDAEVSRVNFDPFVLMAINYSPSKLPVNAFTPFIGSYSVEEDLIRLEPPPDSVFQVGEATAVAYHASTFAALAELAPPPPPLPASFGLSNLIINPGRVPSGQPVTISVDIANDGAVKGSYELYLVIDGIVRNIKEVTLEPRSLATVRFEVNNLAPGNHQVKIAGLTGQFRIVSVAVSPLESQVNWPLVDLSVAAMLLGGAFVSYLLIRRSQRQPR